MISNITKESDMEVRKLTEDIDFADKSRESFKQVVSSAKSTYESVDEIYTIAGQTASMAEKINMLMDNISATTQEAVASTQEVSAASQQELEAIVQTRELIVELSTGAEKVNGQLAEFSSNVKIGEEEKIMINKNFNILKELAQEMKGKNLARNNADDFLKEKATKYKQFEYISILDEKGLAISENEESPPDSLDCSNRTYYKEAIQGKDYYTEPYISKFSFNYCLTISIPLKNNTNGIDGVFMADISMEN